MPLTILIDFCHTRFSLSYIYGIGLLKKPNVDFTFIICVGFALVFVSVCGDHF